MEGLKEIFLFHTNSNFGKELSGSSPGNVPPSPEVCPHQTYQNEWILFFKYSQIRVIIWVGSKGN